MQLFEPQIQQRFVFSDTVKDQSACNFMSSAKGYSLPDQVVRCVSGIGETRQGAFLHPAFPEGYGGNHIGKNVEALLHRIKTVKQSFLVFLHVFVICQGNTLHHCQKGNQVPIHPSGFSADQFRHIRIFFLRHDTTSCTVTVVHFHKTEFICGPQD